VVSASSTQDTGERHRSDQEATYPKTRGFALPSHRQPASRQLKID
jgi:hypothetical protein